MDWLWRRRVGRLDDDEHVRRFQELVRSELPFMTAGLDRLGLRYAAGRQFYHGGRGRRPRGLPGHAAGACHRPPVKRGTSCPGTCGSALSTCPENEKCLRPEKVLRQQGRLKPAACAAAAAGPPPILLAAGPGWLRLGGGRLAVPALRCFRRAPACRSGPQNAWRRFSRCPFRPW